MLACDPVHASQDAVLIHLPSDGVFNKPRNLCAHQISRLDKGRQSLLDVTQFAAVKLLVRLDKVEFATWSFFNLLLALSRLF